MNAGDNARSAIQKGEPNSGVITIQRGLQVLRAFHANRAPLSNAEIVRRTGLPKATVSRLTTTLVKLGYLRHIPGGREFLLAVGALSIGHAFLEASSLLRKVEPYMQELADKLNVTVALAVGDQLEMLYIAYRISHRIATLRLGVGSLLPTGTTAIGRAWLWGLPSIEWREELIAAIKLRAGGQGAAMERGIRTSFAELKATGVCSVLGGYQRDAYGISLPIRVGRRGVPMALSCGTVDVQVDLAAASKRVAPHLIRAAERIEKLLEDEDGLP